MQIRLMYANSRGLLSKLASIKEVLSETDATIACVMETHLSENKGLMIYGFSYLKNQEKESLEEV